jgi:transposase/DNA-binding CsgD family transcriptional regulator
MITPLSQEISDDFWTAVEPLVPKRSRHAGKVYRRAGGGGRKPIDRRKVLSAIFHVLKNRMSWRAVPKSLGSVATVHRYFELWKREGFFARLQNSDLATHPEMAGFPWNMCTLAVLPHSMAESGESLPPPAVPSVTTPVSDAKILRPISAIVSVEQRELSISCSRMQARILKLHGCTEVSSFWNAAQGILRDAIPHNSIIAYLDYLDHPKTWKAVRILASTNAQMPAEWFEKRWKLDITPAYLKSHQGITCFRFSDIIRNSREFQRTEYFNQFFKPFGWHHTACVPFWNGSAINSVIALRRTKEQGDFRPAEVQFLKEIQPHFDTVLRRLLPSHKEQTKLRWLVESAQDIPTALMFLDWNLEPLYVNHEAHSQCAIWNLGAEKARAYNPREVFAIPEDFAGVCSQLKADWLRLYDGARGGKNYHLSAKILNPKDPARMATIILAAAHRETLFKPGFRIQFEHHAVSPNAANDLQQNALLWRLTSAERDLVQLASLGYNNAEIAVRLSKSVNTVKHQFTSIYGKLGVESPRKRYLERIFVDEGSSHRQASSETMSLAAAGK